MGGNELFSPLGIGFIVFLIAALAIDFGLLRKNGTHVVPVKEAAAWTLVWIVLAIIFGVLSAAKMMVKTKMLSTESDFSTR